MLKYLRRKFTLLYTITTGIIITVILLAVFVLSESTRSQHIKENFSMQVNQVQFLFQKSPMMDTKQFLQLERDNHIILSFWENGQTLDYRGYYLPQTSRSVLINKVIGEAAKENVVIGISPSSALNVHSSIFLVKGVDSEQFYGQLVVLPTHQGWQNMIVLKEISDSRFNIFRRLSVYLLIDVIGILFIFWFSRHFVINTLKPVEEDQIKQKEFIAAASHELRSPLAVIKASSQAMLCSKDKQKQEQFAGDIGAEIGRMSKLIDEMLLLASAQTKSWVVKVEAFDLDNFLIEQYEKLLSLVSSTGRKISIELPDQMIGQVAADPNRLYQVLTILVENATSHTGTLDLNESNVSMLLQDNLNSDNKDPEYKNGNKDREKIELKAAVVKQHYQISVIDHGDGISDEDKKHIFEKFYRNDSSRSNTQHYGLGLSIAYELIKRMEGSIHVKDTIGGGTTFEIDLPIAK